MALAVKGDIEKIKELREIAQKEGLDIVHFSYNQDSLIGINKDSDYKKKILELTSENEIGKKTAEILFLINNIGKIRPYEIAEEVKMSCSAIDYHLKILQKKNLIEKDTKNSKMIYYKPI